MTNPTLRDELLNLERPDKLDTSDVVIEAKLGAILQAVSRYVDAVKPEKLVDPHKGNITYGKTTGYNQALDEYQAKLKEGLK